MVYGYKKPNLFIANAEEIQFRNLEPINIELFKGETSTDLNFDISHRLEMSEELLRSNNLLFFYAQINDTLQLPKIAASIILLNTVVNE